MSKVLKIGVMGGTFDPIHFGHLSLASQAASAYGLDKVVFVPTNFSIKKTPVASPLERCAMTAMAVAKDPRFSLSKVDVNRGGATFAFDTLSDLFSVYKPCEFFFILGIDSLAGIKSWKNWKGLFSMARFVASARPGWNLKLSEEIAKKAEFFPSHPLDISSTLLRERVAKGEPIDYFTDSEVCSFILSRGLYLKNNCLSN